VKDGGALLIKGEVCNYKGEKLCEDCYILQYLFSRKAPDTSFPHVCRVIPYQLKNKLIKQDEEANLKLPDQKIEKLNFGKYLYSLAKLIPIRSQNSKM